MKVECRCNIVFCENFVLIMSSLPRKSVVRLTDRPDMTLDVYRGRKTTKQKKKKKKKLCLLIHTLLHFCFQGFMQLLENLFFMKLT